MYSSKKIFKKLNLLLVVLMTATLLTSVASVNAAGSPADSAVQFLQQDYTTNGINNTDSGVGSYALYILTQAGVDPDTWLHGEVSLKDAVISAISGDISNAAAPSNVSAKLLAQDLAAAKSLGQNELADQIVRILKNRQNQSNAGFDANPYSDIPAYDLLGRAGSIDEIDKDHAKDCILGAQNTTAGNPNCGSFGGTYDGIFYPDFMTTAQAVRALNYLDTAKSDAQIQAAVNNGLDWIQKQQQADGSFKAGDWDDPVIDTSEVIVTLKTLGMDPAAWKSSNEKTAVDYLMNNALNADGSFGTSQNAMDATWALYAYNLLDTSGGEGSETEKTVGLAVVGTNGELLYGPSDVTVAETNEWGLTALGVLDASGISYHTSSWSYGVYVDSIGGQANSGMAGWMYVVNGQIPSVGADNYNIDNNDKIIFYYSKSMDQQPPQWDELVPEDTQFYLDPASVTLNAGDKHQLTALWDVASGTTDVTQYAQWSVADDSIAGVDSNGLVTALKAGRTEVNAVYGGLTASADLTVDSSSSGGNGGGDNSRSVGLAVVGTSGELLYGPSNVTVAETNKWGLTALGALDASGISYHASSWSYGYLIDSIGGQANSGMSGWMYVVNGQIPSVGAENYNINKNDKIIFYYSKNMDQQPPKWDELGKQTSGGAGGGGQPANLPAPVSNTALNTAVRNAGTAGLVALQADNTQTALALSSDQLTKIRNTGKPLAVTVQGVQFVLSADSLKVPELMAANTAQLQVKARKLSSGDIQSLMEPFAAKWKLAGDVYELNVLAVNKDGTQKNIEQFPDCKVLLPVPEVFREAAEAGKIRACRYNENSKVWEELGGIYDKTSGSMSFKTEHLSKYALLETVSPSKVSAGKTFKDIAGHWAQKEIEFMATEGYVAGVGDNKFAPEITVTRAEFATILARMAGLTANPGGAEHFNDVPGDAWYRGTVGAAANVGLVYGMGENSFAPSESITREQMAAMIVRLMAKDGLNMTIGDANGANLLADFNDAAGISSWACTSVALMAKEQLMVGRENGQFVPLGETTRAEAAVVLYRVLQKLPQSGK